MSELLSYDLLSILFFQVFLCCKAFLLIIFQFVEKVMQNFNFCPEKSVEFEEEEEEDEENGEERNCLCQTEFHFLGR